MANMTLSQDIVGICLILAGGDADMDLETVLLAAERFQEDNNRHFGIGRRDLRGLFRSLHYWGIIGIDSGHALEWRLGRRLTDAGFGGLRLRDVIPYVLQSHEAYFNDEGEYWIGFDNGADAHTREEYEKRNIDWTGYGWDEYCRKVKTRQAMRQIFRGEERPSRDTVVQFMTEHGVDDRLLHHCSRRGWSS